MCHARSCMPHPSRTQVLTAATLIAFAANSVIGRQGLLSGDIGAGTFACARVIFGALALVVLVGPRRSLQAGDWPAAIALVGYAYCFSYAYLEVGAGAGALVLFAVVQVTMLGFALYKGERLQPIQWGGLVLALSALAWWLWPRSGSPALGSCLTMALAGLGWGTYSLLGVGRSSPVQRTAGNFLRAVPLSVGVLLVMSWIRPEPSPGVVGIGWAALTGAVTSGFGYVLWYTALRGLSASHAGIAQLTVPVIAAGGGIAFLGEPATASFAWAASLILLGVGLATVPR